MIQWFLICCSLFVLGCAEANKAAKVNNPKVDDSRRSQKPSPQEPFSEWVPHSEEMKTYEVNLPALGRTHKTTAYRLRFDTLNADLLQIQSLRFESSCTDNPMLPVMVSILDASSNAVFERVTGGFQYVLKTDSRYDLRLVNQSSHCQSIKVFITARLIRQL